ncbi:hypothetical protein HK098_005396 [Nowakowskiella sp. JEL0407]|nr:hypothetical protein HK098_005396 [Nowakowskiella sp. JEL0407]
MKFLKSPLIILTTAISWISLCAAGQVGVGVGLAFGHRPINDMVGSLHAKNVKYIKLWDLDTTVASFLDELKNQYGDGQVKVTVAIPNVKISEFLNNQNYVSEITQRLIKYQSMINLVCVANEPTLAENQNLDGHPADASKVVPAFQKMVNIIKSNGLQGKMKVTIPFSADVVTNSYPPDQGVFTDLGKGYLNTALPLMREMGSPFSVNLYPYFARIGPSLDERLGKVANGVPSTFVNMIQATKAALKKAGYEDLHLIIGETGWATSGASDANVQNAAAYISHAVNIARTTDLADVVYLFEMFDETGKNNAPDEPWFGIQDFNGNEKFAIDISGSLPVQRDPPTGSGWGWDFYDGYDITGHDLGGRVSASSSTNCQPYCLALTNCYGYSFSDGWCYLKSGPADSLSVSKKSGVNSAIRNPNHNIQANPSGSGYGWEFYDDIDIPGHDLQGVARVQDNSGNRSGCQAACGSTNGCIAYTWSDGWCYLKGGQRSDYSGVKQAPGLYSAFKL